MQIDNLLCGKLVEKSGFLAIFCGKPAEKAVEKSVQKSWKQNVQKSLRWKNSTIKNTIDVQKPTFTRVLQKILNKFLHIRKWWLFPVRRGFYTFST